MDRNTVIATVLITLIMVVWLQWLPQPEPVPPTDPDATADTLAPPPAADPAQPLPSEIAETPAVTDSAFVGEARLITVENERYEAVFSTKGGTLVSFKLKEYERHDHTALVQLVDTTRDLGAIGLFFTTTTSRNVDTRNLYFDADFSGERMQVGDVPQTLQFEVPFQGGMIRQTYTFNPGSYQIDLAVEQVNAEAFATQEGYEIFWSGGIPFTEGNLENEAMRSGAFVRSGSEVEGVELLSDDYDEETYRGDVSWVAVKNKFFTAVIMPQGETRSAELIGEKTGSLDNGTLREHYTARIEVPAPTGVDNYTLYLGPVKLDLLSQYDLELYDMVDFGWDFFESMTRPLAKYIFIPIFSFLHGFIPNYGVVIIVFAILIKLALYPLTKSSYKSMAKTRELQPLMQEIKEKYGDNPQKQQEAMMKMYREKGVNPLGACLPMLFQYPIIIALWQFLPQSIEIRQQPFLWAEDLSAPDVLFYLPFELPLYGDFVAGFTLLMGISMVVQMRIQMNPASNPQAKIFTYVFPVMIFVIFNRLAAGLNLYYLMFNVLTAIQQQFINKGIEAEKDDNGKGSKGGKSGKAAKTKGGTNGRATVKGKAKNRPTARNGEARRKSRKR